MTNTVNALTYKDAGVDIDVGDQFVKAIRRSVKSTYGPQVIDIEDGYGGLYELGTSSLLTKGYKKPVLVAGTDGVGTKIDVALKAGKHDTVGIDLVAMSVNDILVLGATPLFFLDYIVTNQINIGILKQVIEGISAGCREAGCALLGGETAEHPGTFPVGEYDLAGFAVGVVDKTKMILGDTVQPGDAVIGLSSSGLHSNGFSLTRKVFFEAAKWKLDKHVDEFGRTLAEELLTPTQIYVRPVLNILTDYKAKKIIRSLSHITGGGLIENPPRVIPKNCKMVLEKKRWEVPPVFRVIQKLGNVPDEEMYRVYNMGIGMLVVVPPFNADAVVRRFKRLKCKAQIIGRIEKGRREVEIV